MKIDIYIFTEFVLDKLFSWSCRKDLDMYTIDYLHQGCLKCGPRSDWLRTGNCLQLFFALRKEIPLFFNTPKTAHRWGTRHVLLWDRLDTSGIDLTTIYEQYWIRRSLKEILYIADLS